MKVFKLSASLSLLILTNTLYAAGSWGQLHAPEAQSSSYLKSNWNKYNENYHPNYLLDDDPKTAWVEGENGYGEGQHASVRISRLSTAKAIRLRIRNGYQKTKHLWQANSAPQDVQITVYDQDKTITSVKQKLQLVWDWQEVIIPIPGKKGIDRVELKILSVYPGSVYKDTCISDLQIFVQSDVEYNPQLEKKKHAILVEWINKRTVTARYFANKPPEYPFAQTQYQSQQIQGRESTSKNRIYALAKEMVSLKNSGSRYSFAAKRQFAAYPDGVYLPEYFKPFFIRSDCEFFETNKSAPTRNMIMANAAHYQGIINSTFRIKKDGGSVSAVYFKSYKTAAERATTSSAYTENFLKYDATGRIAQMLQLTFVVYFEDREADSMNKMGSVSLTEFQYNATGKIAEFGEYRVYNYNSPAESQTGAVELTAEQIKLVLNEKGYYYNYR